jgi:hypothetical protein
MFVEAKRHQPSVLYIPSILEWSRVLPESAKATFAALMESLTPSEPVLILALHDGSVEDLVKEDDRVKSWFGYSGDHYVEIAPSNIVSLSEISFRAAPDVDDSWNRNNGMHFSKA